jgi:hypothetical protein
MPKPRKLTLVAAAEIARGHDPGAWDAMSRADQLELVAAVNGHHDRAWAADYALRKMFPKMGKQ